MIGSHLLMLLVFSALVACVFAALLRDDLRGQFRFGLGVFAAFVAAALAAGWLMYPFPS